jgi:hypothetical protein
MLRHGLQGILGFVFVGGQELQQHVVVREILATVLLILFLDVLMELPQFAQFVFVMLHLTVEEETRALLLKETLLLLP